MSVAEVSAEFEIAILSAADHILQLQLVAPLRPAPRAALVAAPAGDHGATVAALRDTLVEWREISRELEMVLSEQERISLEARAEVLRDTHHRLFLAICRG